MTGLHHSLNLKIYTHETKDGIIGFSLTEPLFSAAGVKTEILTSERMSDMEEVSGPLEIHLYDTPAEARAAAEITSSIAWDGVFAGSCRLPNGAGALLIKFPEGEFEISVIDRIRASPGSFAETINQSWDMDAAAYGMAAKTQTYSSRTARAIIQITEDFAAGNSDALHEVQVALEDIPGAFVSFVTQSPNGVLSDHGDKLVQSDDLVERIQAAIQSAASNDHSYTSQAPSNFF